MPPYWFCTYGGFVCREEGFGIENLVTEILVGHAVKLIRSALGAQVDNAAGELSPIPAPRLLQCTLNSEIESWSGIRIGKLMYPMFTGWPSMYSALSLPNEPPTW